MIQYRRIDIHQLELSAPGCQGLDSWHFWTPDAAVICGIVGKIIQKPFCMAPFEIYWFNVQQVALHTVPRGVTECHKLWDCTRVQTANVPSRERGILGKPCLKLRWLGMAIVRHAHRSINQPEQLVLSFV